MCKARGKPSAAGGKPLPPSNPHSAKEKKNRIFCPRKYLKGLMTSVDLRITMTVLVRAWKRISLLLVLANCIFQELPILKVGSCLL